MSTSQRVVRILGTHGVPAAYGGFETAAEHIGRYLQRRGWDVVVYCQVAGDEQQREDVWEGMRRVHIPEDRPGWRGTSSFDLKAIRHAMTNREPGEVWLTFGYNTGVFNVLPRLRDVRNVINMDGMEWTRSRWGLAKQAILLGNERFAGLVGTLLVADHPHIAGYLRRHFGRRRVVTITYGADAVTGAPETPVRDLGLMPGEYATVVCRPIPENSVVEIVSAWSRRSRGMKLVVVGPYDREDPYHAEVLDAASDEVVFPGAIFDQDVLRALRFHGAAYLHGHTVGGTNPSLVEAMAAGNAVIAQDNVYNRWVAGEKAEFFTGAEDLAVILDRQLEDRGALAANGAGMRERHAEEFTWEHIGSQYETALVRAGDAAPGPVIRRVRALAARAGRSKQ